MKLKPSRQKLKNLAILGIDEVGRGPWAGPLVVGACVLDGTEIEGLTDSKKLSATKREALAQQICEQCEYGLGWVQAEELDEIGLALLARNATCALRANYEKSRLVGAGSICSGYCSEGRPRQLHEKACRKIPILRL